MDEIIAHRGDKWKEQAEMKTPIVCLGLPRWESDYLTSTIQLMWQLAANRSVLYVEYTYTWKDFFDGFFRRRKVPFVRMMGWQQRLRRAEKEETEMLVLTLPPVIPINWLKNKKWYDRLNRFNDRLVARYVQHFVKKLGWEAPVFINAFNPFYGAELCKQEWSKKVYYCYDEISAARWLGTHGARKEVSLMARMDTVIVSSRALQQRKRRHHSNVQLVENGVDFELFHAAYLKQSQYLPPTIGYLGSVDDRLDVELLEKLAQSIPNGQLLFVGRVVSEAIRERLECFPNVSFAGAQPPEHLSRWLAQLKVGIIPFVTNEFTRNIYPLKINEYLAAGLPVVSTDFTDLSVFQGVATLACNKSGFIEACKQALGANPKTGQQNKRIAFARENSWHHRAQEMDAYFA